jgi:hypothetical protein
MWPRYLTMLAAQRFNRFNLSLGIGYDFLQNVTLRIHGESGVAEGSYDFWRMVFDGIAKGGRPVEIDMHAKGIDQTMIDSALATGIRTRSL